MGECRHNSTFLLHVLNSLRKNTGVMNNNLLAREIKGVLLASLLAVLLFGYVFGFAILNPSYTDWLMERDPAVQYLGWEGYRHEPWTFPIGKISSLAVPQGTSVVYTDSIPLFAIIFKTLSPLLPNNFQYHGLWMLLCLTFQSIMAYLLAGQIARESNFMRLIVAVFFACSPILLVRGEGHYSLMAHSLILAGGLLYLRVSSFKTHLLWLILLATASLVHAALLLNCIAIYIGWLIQLQIETKRLQQSQLKLFFTSIFCLFFVALIMWGVGYFIFDPNALKETGLGEYTFNLNGFFNPQETSQWLRPQAILSAKQSEGYAYLGFGVLILLFISIGHYLSVNLTVGLTMSSKNLQFSKIKWSSLYGYLPILLLGLFSLGDKISFGEQVLSFSYPELINYFLSIFRSTGRMIWPIYYILLYFILAYFIKSVGAKSSLAKFILIFALVLQVLDISPLLAKLKNQHRADIKWSSTLQNEFWHQLGARYTNMYLIPQKTLRWVPLSHMAGVQGLRTNIFFRARYDGKQDIQFENNILNGLMSCDMEPKTVYLFTSKSIFEKIMKQCALPSNSFGFIDKYFVLAPNGAVNFPGVFLADQKSQNFSDLPDNLEDLRGQLDAIMPDSKVYGWALDLSEPSQPVKIEAYVDDPGGVSLENRVYFGEAKKFRPDLDAAGYPGIEHGFEFYLPKKYFDGTTHKIYVFTGRSGAKRARLLLYGSGREFNIQQKGEL